MKKNSLKDVAYRTIKDNILNCQYPPNTFINESAICEELNMSRTPIREAINRLEQENFVTVFSKRGVLVTDISLPEINNIYDVRKLVEPHIIRTHAHTIDMEQLISTRDKLLQLAEEGEDAKYQADRDIHNLILKSSNNRYYLYLMENIYDQNHRLRILSGQKVSKRLEVTNQEHLEILGRMIEDDYENAAKSMISHLDNSRTAAIEGMLMR